MSYNLYLKRTQKVDTSRAITRWTQWQERTRYGTSDRAR